MAKPNPGKIKEKAGKYLKRGKLDKALEMYEELEKISQDDLRVPQKIAEILNRMGNQKKAIQKYKESANKYREKGFLVQAIAIWKVVEDLAPDDEEAKDAIANLSEERSGPLISNKPKPKKIEPKPAPEPEPEEEIPAEPEEEEITDIPAEAVEELEELDEEDDDMEEDDSGFGISDEDELEDLGEDAISAVDDLEMDDDLDMNGDLPIDLDGEDLMDMGEEPDGELIEDHDDLAFHEDEDMELDIVPLEEEEELPESGPDHTPLFSDLERNEFDRVFELLQSKVVDKGEVVLKEGEEGRSIYIVARGEVNISRKDQTGQSIDITVLGPGDFFGEIGYFHGQRRATVTTIKKCILLKMSKEDLDTVVEEFPRVKEVLIQFYRERVLDNMLTDSPLFNTLTFEERDTFKDKFIFHEFKDGETIVKEGDPGDSMFLIKFGEVRVVGNHPVTGEELELAKLGETNFFGEVSLIKNKPRTATIVALGDVEVLELKRKSFKDIAKAHPEIGSSLEHTIEKRVEATIKKIVGSDND